LRRPLPARALLAPVLEITSVSVQRAWDMTDADALASGIKRIPRGYTDGVGGLHVTAKAAYRSFWLTTRGTDWHSNPWVWVITCKQAEEPTQPTTPSQAGERASRCLACRNYSAMCSR
jgi:hypothetical protein